MTIKITDTMFEDIEIKAAKRRISICEVIHEWLFEAECQFGWESQSESSLDFYTDEAIAKEDHNWDEAGALREELESLRPV